MKRLKQTILAGSLMAAYVFADSSAPYLPRVTNLYYGETLGTFRADEGTLELRVDMKRPPQDLGVGWSFVFSMVPAQKLGEASRNLFGLFIPPRPEKGLRVIFRDGMKTRYLSDEGFTWSPGQPFLLSVSWGKALRLVRNGAPVAELREAFAFPENLIPPYFLVDAGDHWRVQALRLSTRELSPSELWKDVREDFRPERDTALLVTRGMTATARSSTPWLLEKGFCLVKPLWNERYSILDTDDEPFYPLLAVNYGEKARGAQLKLGVRKVDGGVVLSREYPITIPPGGKPAFIKVPMPELKGRGFYTLLSDLSIPSEKPLQYKSTLAVFPARKAGEAEGALVKYLCQHYEEQFALEAYRKPDFRALRVGGRNPFMWPRVEPAQGDWDWSLADEVVAGAQKNGIEILGILGNTPLWAGTDPGFLPKNGYHAHAPRSAAAFGHYVGEVAARYKGRVAYWEIWNEVDWHPPAPPFSFTGSTADYRELLKAAYASAKKADPACQVLISGFGLFGDKKMPGDLFGMGAADSFDIFNFHAYAGVAALEGLQKQVDRFKPGAPVWNSEHMWHEMNGGEKRHYLTVAAPLWFLEKKVARYFYMGMAEYYMDRTTLSPATEYWVLGFFQSRLRSCERFEGLLSFPGDSDYSVKHVLRGADQSYLTILGTELGEHEVTLGNEILSADDLYGTPMGPLSNRVLLISNLVYLRTREPLVVRKSVAMGSVRLFANGGFEEVAGDIAAGGLGAGRALGWTLRETVKDPAGKIGLDLAARSGKYALRVATSGKGSVYAFQDIRLPSTGTYTLSAHFRSGEGTSTAIPFVRFFDRSANLLPEKSMEAAPGKRYRELRLRVTVSNMPSLPCALIVGALGGEGSLLIDDLYFGKGEGVPRTVDESAVDFVDLTRFVNQSWRDEEDGDGKGGFADMGHQNFSRLATGRRMVGGGAFQLLPDEGGARASCLVLGGSVRPSFPMTISSIPLPAKAQSLSFLHTALWVKAAKGEALGKAVIYYKNGKRAEHVFAAKQNIDDWFIPAVDPGVQIAEAVTLPDNSQRAIFASTWKNPEPETPLDRMDFISTGKAVLVLMAVTSERPEP